MVRLVLAVLVEIVIGLAIAAIVLAVRVPMMIGGGLMAPGDLVGTLAIAAVLAAAVGGMLLRPGSAICRYSKRSD